MSDITKKVVSFIGLLVNAIIGVVLRKVFQVWGVFDPFSERLGGWLKMRVTPAQIEWTIAGIIAVAAYAAMLWFVWARRTSPIANAHANVSRLQPMASPPKEIDPSSRISLLELLSEAAAKGWSFHRDTLQAFTQVLRQAASEGSVVIWGILKNGRDPISAPSLYVPEKIATAYFKEHWIDAHQGWVHNDNRYVSTSVPSGKNEPNLYSNLQVEKNSALAWLDSITK